MTTFRCLVVLLAVAACSESRPPANPPTDPDEKPVDSPFVLSLAVNHDGSQRVLRGWPLVVRVSATLDRAPVKAFTLDERALTVRVLDAAGTAEAWALEAPVAPVIHVLDTEHPSLEVIRVLPASAAATLAPGARTFEVTWGTAKASFPATVEDAPADSAAVREARAMLEADEQMVRGQLTTALAALDAALATEPQSVVLLNQRALVRERGNDFPGAYTDAQAALRAFVAQYPDAHEPPITILQVIDRIEDRVIGGAP